MNQILAELQQYRDYAASTQCLNEALARELDICYQRITNMDKELNEAQNIHQQLRKQIIQLKEVVEELQMDKRGTGKTKSTERIISFENIRDGSFEKSLLFEAGGVTSKKLFLTQNKQIQTDYSESRQQSRELLQQYEKRQQKIVNDSKTELQSILTENLSLKYELQVFQQQIVQLRTNQIEHSLQLKRWQQKYQDIQNLRIKNIHEMMTEKEFLIYEIKSKDEIINNLNELCRQKELQKNKIQNSQVILLKQKLAKIEKINTQHFDMKKIMNDNNDLQNKVRELESQLKSLQLNRSRFRSPSNHSNQQLKVKPTTLLETQLKMVKQEYTQAIKKNINLTDLNSKLEKKRVQLDKTLEKIKHEKIQIQHKYHQLKIEFQHVSKQLIKNGRIMEDMSNKITIKQNEAQQLKSKASQHIIDQLQKTLNSPVSPKISKSIIGCGRKNNWNQPKQEQIPVRDVQSSLRVLKSRSTIILNVKDTKY